MVWRYNSLLGQKGNLEIDLNYMYRQPLLEIQNMKPALAGLDDFTFPVLDIHELAAGKLSALLSRNAGRDLFDAHHLLTKTHLNEKKIRFAFVAYMSMTALPLERLSVVQLQYNIKDLHNRLLPVLRQRDFPTARVKLETWAKCLIDELKSALSVVLPLSVNEQAFIKEIQTAGRICPELITGDERLQTIIQNHPAILWAAKKQMVVG